MRKGRATAHSVSRIPRSAGRPRAASFRLIEPISRPMLMPIVAPVYPAYTTTREAPHRPQNPGARGPARGRQLQADGADIQTDVDAHSCACLSRLYDDKAGAGGFYDFRPESMFLKAPGAESRAESRA